MWLVAWFLPMGEIVLPARMLFAIILAGGGAATSALGVVAFRRASTTVNPLQPGLSSHLVRSGVYAWSRNPMYLGFLLILLGWGVFLANAITLLLLPLFVFYIYRFQIRPEERALTLLFGPDFVMFLAQVRRWI
jgi:protein-S-isoprenylcysteine O-methyltransferase Ste14